MGIIGVFVINFMGLGGKVMTDFKNCPNPDGCFCDGTCKKPVHRDDRFWEQQIRQVEIKESTPTLEGVLKSISALINEVDCRISHGADSNGHLEYVLKKLKEIKK